jgi:hypothetical protein
MNRNVALMELQLNGNVLGKEGGRAMVEAMSVEIPALPEEEEVRLHTATAEGEEKVVSSRPKTPARDEWPGPYEYPLAQNSVRSIRVASTTYCHYAQQ